METQPHFATVARGSISPAYGYESVDVGFVGFCLWGDFNFLLCITVFAYRPRAPFLMSQSAPALVPEMGECTGAGGGFGGGGESHRWYR